MITTTITPSISPCNLAESRQNLAETNVRLAPHSNAMIAQRLAQWDTRSLQADAIQTLGISEDQCRDAIRLYKQFWQLIALYPQHCLVPPAIVDRLWHLHILDTRRYREDCLSLVGYFIDHQPHHHDTNADNTHQAMARQTLALLEESFGTDVREQLQVWQGLLQTQGERPVRTTKRSELSEFAACNLCYHVSSVV